MAEDPGDQDLGTAWLSSTGRMDQKLAALVSEVDKLKAVVGAADSESTLSLDSSLAQLQEELEGLRKENEDVRGCFVDALAAADALRQENEELRKLSEEAVLDTQMVKALNETEKLKAAADAYKKDLLAKDLAEREAELAETREALRKAEAGNEELQQLIEELKSGAAPLAGGTAPKQAPSAEAGPAGDLLALAAQLEAAKWADGGAEPGLLAAAGQALRAAHAAVHAAELESAEMKKENEKLAREVKELNDTVFSKSFKAPSAWAEREVKYKMDKRAWEEQVQKLKQRMEALQAENRQYRDSNKAVEFEDRIKELQAMLAKAETEKVSAQRALHDLQIELQKMNANGEFTFDGQRVVRMQSIRGEDSASDTTDGIYSIIDQLEADNSGPLHPRRMTPRMRAPVSPAKKPSSLGTPAKEEPRNPAEPLSVQGIIIGYDAAGVGLAAPRPDSARTVRSVPARRPAGAGADVQSGEVVDEAFEPREHVTDKVADFNARKIGIGARQEMEHHVIPQRAESGRVDASAANMGPEHFDGGEDIDGAIAGFNARGPGVPADMARLRSGGGSQLQQPPGPVDASSSDAAERFAGGEDVEGAIAGFNAKGAGAVGPAVRPGSGAGSATVPGAAHQGPADASSRDAQAGFEGAEYVGGAISGMNARGGAVPSPQAALPGASGAAAARAAPQGPADASASNGGEQFEGAEYLGGRIADLDSRGGGLVGPASGGTGGQASARPRSPQGPADASALTGESGFEGAEYLDGRISEMNARGGGLVAPASAAGRSAAPRGTQGPADASAFADEEGFEGAEYLDGRIADLNARGGGMAGPPGSDRDSRPGQTHQGPADASAYGAQPEFEGAEYVGDAIAGMNARGGGMTGPTSSGRGSAGERAAQQGPADASARTSGPGLEGGEYVWDAIAGTDARRDGIPAGQPGAAAAQRVSQRASDSSAEAAFGRLEDVEAAMAGYNAAGGAAGSGFGGGALGSDSAARAASSTAGVAGSVANSAAGGDGSASGLYDVPLGGSPGGPGSRGAAGSAPSRIPLPSSGARSSSPARGSRGELAMSSGGSLSGLTQDNLNRLASSSSRGSSPAPGSRSVSVRSPSRTRMRDVEGDVTPRVGVLAEGQWTPESLAAEKEAVEAQLKNYSATLDPQSLHYKAVEAESRAEMLEVQNRKVLEQLEEADQQIARLEQQVVALLAELQVQQQAQQQQALQQPATPQGGGGGGGFFSNISSSMSMSAASRRSSQEDAVRLREMESALQEAYREQQSLSRAKERAERQLAVLSARFQAVAPAPALASASGAAAGSGAMAGIAEASQLEGPPDATVAPERGISTESRDGTPGGSQENLASSNFATGALAEAARQTGTPEAAAATEVLQISRTRSRSLTRQRTFGFGAMVDALTDEELEVIRLRDENESLMEALVRAKVELADMQGDYLQTRRALIRANERQAAFSERMAALKTVEETMEVAQIMAHANEAAGLLIGDSGFNDSPRIGSGRFPEMPPVGGSGGGGGGNPFSEITPEGDSPRSTGSSMY